MFGCFLWITAKSYNNFNMSTLFLLYIKLVSKNDYRNKPVVGSFCFHYSSFTLEGHSTNFTCESVHLTVGALLRPGAQIYVIMRVWSELFKVRLLTLKRDNNTAFLSQMKELCSWAIKLPLVSFNVVTGFADTALRGVVWPVAHVSHC